CGGGWRGGGGGWREGRGRGGRAPPRRSVCAPGTMSHHRIADQPGTGELTMSLHSWLQSLRSALAPGRGRHKHGHRGSKRAPTHRPNLETLEDRSVPAFLAPVDYPVGSRPVEVQAGDFNGDGIPDLANANVFSKTVSVFLGNGD